MCKCHEGKHLSIVYSRLLLLRADLTGGSRFEIVGVISTRWLLFVESVRMQDSVRMGLIG